MTREDRRDREAGAGETVRGALLILAAGIGLGVAFNALGLASRPLHGLAWRARPQAVQSLEALQPARGVESPPDTTAHGVASGGTVTHGTDAPRERQARHAPHAPTHARAESPAPIPGPLPASTVHPPAESDPHAGASSEPAAARASDLPVIPDVAGPLQLEIAAFKKLYDAGAALIVDAREAGDYVMGHIAGAINLPYNDALADPDKVKQLESGGRPIVVYCSGGTCELSMDLAKLLARSGFHRVLVYEAGYPEWEAARFPVARGPAAGVKP